MTSTTSQLQSMCKLHSCTKRSSEMNLHIKSSHDAHRVTTRAAERSIFLLGRVIVRTARGYSSEASEVCDTFENTMRQAGLRRQNPCPSWKTRAELCAELQGGICCACAKNEPMSCTAYRRPHGQSYFPSGRQEMSMEPIVNNFQKFHVRRV